MDVCADDPALTGKELTSLLIGVYVGGGFTEDAIAPSLFASDAVRARGTIVTARENGVLAGLVILVSPDSNARRIAKDGEVEIQLLAVRPESRGRGVGRALLSGVLTLARKRGYKHVVLSTQEKMIAANAIYLSAGFQRTPDRDWNRGPKSFLTYSLVLPEDDEPTI